MRVPSDLPRRRNRNANKKIGNRGRVALIAIFGIILVLFFSARSLSGFYIETLWFRSVGRSDVFWTVLRTKVLLAVLFTAAFVAVAAVSLAIADRMAPMIRPAGPEEQVLERYREIVGHRHGMVRMTIAVLFGLIAGLPASAHWEEWLLFRNAVSFGIDDAQFSTDVGFYVFRLPFLNYLVNWLFAAFVVIAMLTALAHYLNGGIRLQPGGRRVTPQVKLHLSALLAVLAVLKAADYWLQRFELTTSTRGYVEGATYTDVNAQLPALQLLMLISVLAAVLLFVNVRQRGWRLPIIAVGLWLVIAVIAGTLYPAIVQRFQVQPSESSRESEYISRNIAATRAAMGISDVDVQPFVPGTIDADELEDNRASIENVRLLTPGVVGQTFRQDQGLRTGYVIGGATRDLDVDRYVVDGERQQVVLAARELDLENLPLNSWEGRHLAYTHGYGLAFAPASRTDDEGRPLYVAVDGPDNELELERPEVYFGDRLGGYAVVDTDREGGEETLDPAKPSYEGTGGVRLSSRLRRLAFAIYEGEYNLFGSKLINDESRIIYYRDVRQRISKVAPFLKLDADPYPVVADGRLVWVIDAYTTTSRYPNAESADTRQLSVDSGLRSSFNYVRNSVKAVVDAYDGTVTLYRVDTEDPIAAAWANAFPDLFTDASEVPAELREHFRYPEDLFRVQTNLYGRYQLDDAGEFYTRKLAWSVSQAAPSTQIGATAAASATGDVLVTNTVDPSGRTSDPDTDRFVPYYTMFRNPTTGKDEFSLVRPFVPYSTNDERRELTAFMTVSSEPDTYGNLTAYVVQGPSPDGPYTVAQKTSQRFSEELTLIDSKGTKVVFGDLQLVPVGDGLLYIRPWFLQQEATGQQYATLEAVSITYNDRYVKGATLGDALNQLFDTDLDLGAPATTTDDNGETTTTPDTGEDTPDSLLEEAQAAYDEAQQALEEFDSKTYADKMDEAFRLAAEAAKLATGLTVTAGSPSTGSGSSDQATTTTVAPTTTTGG